MLRALLQGPQWSPPGWREPVDTLRWLRTLVRTVHDTIWVARPGPEALWGLSRAELFQAGVAVIGVAVPIGVLLWEVWGRRWLRERKPAARLLYQEILSNYLTLMGHQWELDEGYGRDQIKQVPHLPGVVLRQRVFSAFQGRIDALPGDLPEKIIALYSLLEDLPRIQDAARREPDPRAPRSASYEVLYVLAEGMRRSRSILVRLHKLNNVREDLRVVLRGQFYSSTADANQEEALQAEWDLRSYPPWLRGLLGRVRRWRTRRRLWRELRDKDTMP
jgi:hypothetical protein